VPGMFANPAAADLHLVATATNAIDKAPSLSTVTNDFDGDPRPRGARSDIGADEFTSKTPPRLTGLNVVGFNCVISLLTLLGESYDLLRADDLSTGAWGVVAVNQPGSGDVILITDTNAATQPRLFYRARLTP